MLIRLFPSILLLLSLEAFSVIAQFSNLDEFRYGYGGFGIKAGYPSAAPALSFQLDEYQIWGYAFQFQQKDFGLRVSVCTPIKGRKYIENIEKRPIVAKWKAELIKKLGNDAPIQEKAFVFEGFTGYEIVATDTEKSITRLFFARSFLIEETIVVDKDSDLNLARQVLDSFRLLNKDERNLAMIAEFTPPPLSQEKPDRLPTADSVEQGILGPVRRIRDTFQPAGKTPSEVVQEIHFDQDGFTSSEIVFNKGFPDIITTWGWAKGKRVNLQSAVNYPQMEGPVGGRTAVISGSYSMPGLTVPGGESEYGNLIETKRDDKGRITERRRYTSIGTLVYIERFTYEGDRCTIKTVDEGGGFIGQVRNRLDPNNNLLETETLADNGSPVSYSRYEYQFDNKGNWIVKKAFSRARSGRRNTSTLIGTYYRNISYYETTDLRQVGKAGKRYFRLT